MTTTMQDLKSIPEGTRVQFTKECCSNDVDESGEPESGDVIPVGAMATVETNSSAWFSFLADDGKRAQWDTMAIDPDDDDFPLNYVKLLLPRRDYRVRLSFETDWSNGSLTIPVCASSMEEAYRIAEERASKSSARMDGAWISWERESCEELS
jgi:hypothetical protein